MVSYTEIWTVPFSQPFSGSPKATRFLLSVELLVSVWRLLPQYFRDRALMIRPTPRRWSGRWPSASAREEGWADWEG